MNKKINFLLAFFLLVIVQLHSQSVNLDDGSCLAGPDMVTVSGNDGGSPARNIFTGAANNGGIPIQIIWANNRWEIQFDTDGNGTYETLLHANTFASAPNPPQNGTGTWTNETGGTCGNLTQVDGSGTQTVLLPVKIAAFEAEELINSVKLNWVTISEVNNEKFEVQYSRNGKDFDAVGTVQGNGTTNEKERYAFMHENPTKGINYYRLKQMDYDGAFEYSSIIEFNFQKEDETLSVFPNPTEDYVSLPELRKGTTVQVFTTQGQLVLQRKVNDDQQLSLNDLPEGMYWIQSEQQGQVRMGQIVKL